MINTWPGGVRHAMSQAEHERWNASNYPGTSQICELCDEPTEQCEEDAFVDSEGHIVCRECYYKQSSEREE